MSLLPDMRTEARRRYSSGFVLNEQELRRIHDVVDQQMQRALPNGTYETLYEVRYKNGAIAEPKTLDEILDQENWGSAAIRLVSLTCREGVERPHVRISVRFTDGSNEEESIQESILYEVEGNDRDWVFVASSQLSERIARVERFNFFAFTRWRSLPLVVMILFLLSMIGSLAFVRDPTVGKHRDSLYALRDAWKTGSLRDPVDTMLKVEELRLEHDSGFPVMRVILLPLTLPMGVVLLTIGGVAFLRYAIPPYNFVWGEYQRDYEKRRGRVRLE